MSRNWNLTQSWKICLKKLKFVLLCLPEIGEPFNQLRCVIFVKFDIGEIHFQYSRAWISHPEEHKFRFSKMHWRQRWWMNASHWRELILILIIILRFVAAMKNKKFKLIHVIQCPPPKHNSLNYLHFLRLHNSLLQIRDLSTNVKNFIVSCLASETNQMKWINNFAKKTRQYKVWEA